MEQFGTDEPRASPDPPGDRRSADGVLARLLAEHGELMYRLARSVVHDGALADDVVQETLVKAWRALDSFEDGVVPRAWLLKVTRNTAISMLRSRRDEVREGGSFAEVADREGGPATTTLGRAELDQLWRHLAALDEDSRSLVVLRELSGLSYEEISDVLGLPLPTVKTRLFRARRALQDSMKEWRA